jgi:hypothetical protein
MEGRFSIQFRLSPTFVFIKANFGLFLVVLAYELVPLNVYRLRSFSNGLDASIDNTCIVYIRIYD